MAGELLQAAPLMDPSEQQLVLQGFNDTDLHYDSKAFVHDLFMQRAKETPDAPCVTYEDSVFTYAEVRHHADSAPATCCVRCM
jgi:non-ribosomal peptide synthetase component F